MNYIHLSKLTLAQFKKTLASSKELGKLKVIFDDAYYNGEAIISDAKYDWLVEHLNSTAPDSIKTVGHDVKNEHIRTSLPYYLGSLDKIKEKDERRLVNWVKKYKAPYIVEDKLDGVSCLLMVDSALKYKLYTRGNGSVGSDVMPY